MEDVSTSVDYEAELAAQILDQQEALQGIQDAIEAEPSEELIEVGEIRCTKDFLMTIP